jgi:hypothetical protein
MSDTTPDYGSGSNVTLKQISNINVSLTGTDGSSLVYAFIVADSPTPPVILSGTLSISGGTPVAITGVAGTPLPLTNFNLTGSYGVTLPTIGDGVYTVTLEIIGVDGSSQAFDYVTDTVPFVGCALSCCVSKMIAKLDPTCNCSEKAMDKATEAFMWLQCAIFSAQGGNITNAQNALTKGQSICDCGCGCN